MDYNSQIIKTIQDYCLGKPLAYESRPFGEHPICYRLMGKIFAQFIPVESFYRITLKCKPEKAELYRQLFPDVVVRGYHCPPVHQPYWNTVNLDLFNDMDLLLQMIDEAYDLVADSFSRKTKVELSALSELDYVYADGITSDFIYLYSKLCPVSGENLNEDLPEGQDYGYDLKNSIHDAVIAYHNGKAVACGGLKMHDEERAEIVHLYTEPDFKGIGLEAEIIRRLEAKAQIRGYKQCIIKIIRINGMTKASDQISSDKISAVTEDEAYNLYKKAGYRLMTDDGPGPDISDVVYMVRKI